MRQVVTVKNKYIVENQTGMIIEFKQRGTPDLEPGEPCGSALDPLGRAARRLHVNERAPVHWDDSELERMLVMRPLEDEHCTRCSFSYILVKGYNCCGCQVRNSMYTGQHSALGW